MVAHPRKAVPGAVPGRKLKLPLSRLGEAYALAASGCSIEEIAAGLGVDRSTLFRRRNNAPEYCDTIRRGRADFERGVRLGQVRFNRQLTLKQAARTAQQARAQAAQLCEARKAVLALLGEEEPATSPEAPSAVPYRQPASEPMDEQSYTWPGFGSPRDVDPPTSTEALPLDDPLADWRD